MYSLSELPVTVSTHLFDSLLDETSEIITVMYGNAVEMDELEAISLYLEEHYSEVEVETVAGHQDIYSYIIAVE